MNGIDAATKELNDVFQAASQEMYNAQAQQPGGEQPNANAQNNESNNNTTTNDNGDTVTDVDFEEVK